MRRNLRGKNEFWRQSKPTCQNTVSARCQIQIRTLPSPVSFDRQRARNPPMFRFTIRDVLWLTVVVGLAVGWWLHSQQLDWARAKAESNADAGQHNCKLLAQI